MASRTSHWIRYVQVMKTCVVAVVLRCPRSMAGVALRVDIYDTCQPGRRGLAPVTAGAGAGAAVAAGRAALSVEAGQNADIVGAVIMS